MKYQRNIHVKNKWDRVRNEGYAQSLKWRKRKKYKHDLAQKQIKYCQRERDVRGPCVKDRDSAMMHVYVVALMSCQLGTVSRRIIGGMICVCVEENITCGVYQAERTRGDRNRR